MKAYLVDPSARAQPSRVITNQGPPPQQWEASERWRHRSKQRRPPLPIIKESTSKREPIQSHNPSGKYTKYKEDGTLISATQNEGPRQAIVRINPTGIG
jgi:hypothetical protein